MTGTMNSVGVNKGKSIFKGDSVFIKNVQISEDAVCSCGTPWWSLEMFLTLKVEEFQTCHEGTWRLTVDFVLKTLTRNRA
jgi:hypothetical protein